MSNKKIVLIVVNDAEFFLSHRSDLASYLKKSGYRVIVSTPFSFSVEEIKRLGFEHYSIPMSRAGIHLFKEWLSIRSLYRLFRSLKPDAVQLITLKPVLYGGIAARLAGINAVLYTITGRGHLYSSQKKSYQLLRLFFNFLLRFSFSHPNSKVLIQNNEDKEYFIKQRLLMPSQTVLIKGSGVDMEKFRPYPIPPSPPFVVLLACRLLWSKGVGEYVEAARLLKNKFNAQFLLAGKIDYENPEAISPQQIHQWDQEGCIEYLGFYANMLPLFQCAHVVCLPTCYGEGIPKVLIEAAAVGRPIVTTQTPGCNAIVQEGVNGHLVPPKDFRALAEALQSFFIQPEKIDSMGKASRQRVEKEYDINVVNQTILEAYEELVR